MVTKPVKLDTIHFVKAGDATIFFREMLNRYRPGMRVSEADEKHLHALIKFHTEAPEKIGCGISHFEVMAAEYGTQCFRIVRTDGSKDDFSLSNPIKAAANA